MKKYLLILVAGVALVGAGCATQTQTSTEANNDTTQVVEEVKKPQELDLASIMEAVKAEFSTVQDTKVLTEENDPYGNLGKAGYYTAGAAFWDTRTEYSEAYKEESELGKWGASAGGMIEVYATDEEAKSRIEYMQAFVGNPLTEPGAFKQIGTVVIRASSELTATQQNEIMAFLEEQVTK